MIQRSMGYGTENLFYLVSHSQMASPSRRGWLLFTLPGLTDPSWTVYNGNNLIYFDSKLQKV